MRHLISLWLSCAVFMLPATLLAQERHGHGPSSNKAFSHDFQLKAHRYNTPQLNVHFGLSQPLLFNAFNVAADLRLGRLVLEYSHGVGLDYNATPGVVERFFGNDRIDLDSPWTTGAGVGYILLDDLYLMLEAKVHRYDVALDGERASFTTASLGPALAYRLFLWKGLNMTAYARYWPNIWTSTGGQDIAIAQESLAPVNLGLFGNLSVGWSFDLFTQTSPPPQASTP